MIPPTQIPPLSDELITRLRALKAAVCQPELDGYGVYANGLIEHLYYHYVLLRQSEGYEVWRQEREARND